MKHYKILMVFVLSLVAYDVQAQDGDVKDDLGIDPALCRHIVAYQPDVGVDYQPGVDVKGNPVVGADLHDPVIPLPEVIEFPIQIDAAQALGVPIPPGSETQFPVGTITYETTGANKQLKFNGEPLTPKSQSALIALCKKDK